MKRLQELEDNRYQKDVKDKVSSGKKSVISVDSDVERDMLE